MKGILAGRFSQTVLGDWWYSNTGLPIGLAKLAKDSYEETDPSVDNIVLDLLHTYMVMLRTEECVAPNDKPGKHHVIVGAVQFLSWWGATEAASNVDAVTRR